jgi:hypothetical protein
MRRRRSARTNALKATLNKSILDLLSRRESEVNSDSLPLTFAALP